MGRPVAGAKVSLQAASGKVVAKTAHRSEGPLFICQGVYPGTYAVMATEAVIQTRHEDRRGGAGKPKELTLAMASEQALSLNVVAKRLDVARNSLSPQTGGSVYRFNRAGDPRSAAGQQHAA